MSKPQKQVKDFLRPYWESHVVLEEFIIPGSRLRCDLLNVTRHIAVEVSPDGSHSFNPFFHRGSKHRFFDAVRRDLNKTEWLKKNGFTYVEVQEDDFDKLSPEWFLETYDVTL